MPGYTLPRHAWEDVLAGKAFTVFNPRRAARHVAVGDLLTLRFGRVEDGRTLPAVCAGRATLYVTRDGLRRVVDDTTRFASPRTSPAHPALHRVWAAEAGSPDAARAADQLAVGLGHTGWADFWRSVVASGKGEVSPGVYQRELIVWTLLQDQVAA